MDLLRKIFKGDKVIWVIFLLLCLISIVEVFSAASTLTYKTGDHWGPITQHSVILLIGVVIVVITHNIQYKWFQALPVIIYPISLLLLMYISIMGMLGGGRINDAARWMTFMGIQFQPSEIAKMAVVILVSFLLSKQQDDEGANPKVFKYILLFTVPVCVLILVENFSTAILLFGVVFLMMYIGRIAARKLLSIVGIVVLLAGFAVGTIFLASKIDERQMQRSEVVESAQASLTPEKKKGIPFLHRFGTWKNRITNFFDKEEVTPAEFDMDKNAQVAHARIAIATSNLVGKMPGNSVQRDFLSQAFSDFIYAIIIEEMGLIGGGFVVILYILLLIRAGRIANKCDRSFPVFLVLGIALLLVSQALLNMAVAVGMFPVTGQPLPLISKGGTSIWVNCAYIGMILSVSRYTAHLEEIRKQNESIPLEITNESQYQTTAEPTSEVFNSDTVFEEVVNTKK